MRTKLATFLLALILLFSMSILALAYEVNVTGGYASCPYSFRPHYSFSTHLRMLWEMGQRRGNLLVKAY